MDQTLDLYLNIRCFFLHHLLSMKTATSYRHVDTIRTKTRTCGSQCLYLAFPPSQHRLAVRYVDIEIITSKVFHHAYNSASIVGLRQSTTYMRAIETWKYRVRYFNFKMS
jgi:hypothetical protein